MEKKYAAYSYIISILSNLHINRFYKKGKFYGEYNPYCIPKDFYNST